MIGAGGCATAGGSPAGDSGASSATTTIPSFDASRDSSPVIITGSMDTGLPSITITNDGGSHDATLTADATSTPDAGAPLDATPTEAASSLDAPRLVDAATTPDAPAATDASKGAGDAGGEGNIPTTCAEANTIVGCCGPGEKNYYCASPTSTTVKSVTCAAGNVCGWSAADGDYECVAPPATSDPSATNPITCGGTRADAGKVTPDAGAVGGGTPTTCTQADNAVGCCGANGKNYYCATGSTTVTAKACSGTEVCGWSASRSYYYCVAGPATADPSGTYPIACK